MYQSMKICTFPISVIHYLYNNLYNKLCVIQKTNSELYKPAAANFSCGASSPGNPLVPSASPSGAGSPPYVDGGYRVKKARMTV